MVIINIISFYLKLSCDEKVVVWWQFKFMYLLLSESVTIWTVLYYEREKERERCSAYFEVYLSNKRIDTFGKFQFLKILKKDQYL